MFYGDYVDLLKRIDVELAKEYSSKSKWNPDKQCMKCGRELHWVRMALVCKEHGLAKGC